MTRGSRLVMTGAPRAGFSPPLLLLVVSLAAGLSVSIAFAQSLSLFLMGLMLVITVAILLGIRSDVELLIFLVMTASGVISLPRAISLGDVSAGAAVTVLVASLGFLFVIASPVSLSGAWSAGGGLLPFLLWAVFSFLWSRPTVAGAQNLLVVLAFTSLVIVAATRARHVPKLPDVVGRMLVAALLLSGGLYLFSVWSAGVGTKSFIAPRSFALLADVGLAWAVAKWRTGHRFGLWLSVYLGCMILLSLSRLAFAVALVLVPLAWLNPFSLRHWLRVILISGVSVLVFYLAITHFQPLRDRFFEGDVKTVAGGLTINVSGRQSLWRTAWRSFLESPWVGKGAGSADNLIAEVSPRSGHPHNDYLRILHDYGLVGMALWAFGFGGLVRATLRRWLRGLRSGSVVDHGIHLAAFLGLLSVALGMVTDNTMIYLSVMGPLALLVGASLGAPSAERVIERPERVHAARRLPVPAR